MRVNVHAKLINAGYEHVGKNEAGDRYVKGPFTIYHSGYMVFIIRGQGMIRNFREDRLLFYSVSDLERQASIRPIARTGREDMTNYDIVPRC